MGRKQKDLRFVLAFIREKAKSGELKSGILETAERECSRLQHALSVGDIKAIRKRLGAVARLFTKID
ncbi:hypothetical protein ABI59_19660 [Acidobacteria bacterium Mor1]|nr:hypothetical protein ABI59_19660 [Acidobacteria bacterium Mor1]